MAKPGERLFRKRGSEPCQEITGNCRRGWESDVTVGLKEISLIVMDRISVGQDRDQ